VIVIQPALLVAFQLHPVSVVTSNESRPPSPAIESLVRLSAYWHGAADWLTSTVCALTTIAPERGVGTGFGATL
jgi:hypothetical protein